MDEEEEDFTRPPRKPAKKGKPFVPAMVDRPPPPTFEDILGHGPDPIPLSTPVAVPQGMTPRQVEYCRTLILEARKRQWEALRLYEPLPAQASFHMSRSHQRIARGGNRSGKTTTTMVELAWAATGTHPQPGKYPARDGRAFVVAKDLEKIGEVIWRKLGRAGAFKILQDPVSGLWRSWRPSDGDCKTKPAPPLIPPRLIVETSWESRKANIPKKVILANGWEINFYSSKADPFSIAGSDVDIVIFDEEIVHADWYPEAQARLIDRRGWFWWGATPQTGTQQLYDLHLRAEALAEEQTIDPPVTEVFLSIWDNPHLDAKAKQDFVDSIDDEERRIRVDGEFAITGLKVYESYFFPRGLHSVPAFPVPANWTRFVAIDPGAQVGAVLFAAVPPARYDGTPEIDPALYGDFLYLFDEIYLRGCDAQKLATSMRTHIGEQAIQAFLIDHHGGRLTEIGSGKTPEQQYKEAFKTEKVPMPALGSWFVYGSDDLDGGILRVRDWLRVRDDGTSRIRILAGTCRNLIHEMARYQWKVVGGIITDKPMKKADHLCDCLRYLCMYPGLKHVKPKPGKSAAVGAYASFKAYRDREKARKSAAAGTGVTLA